MEFTSSAQYEILGKPIGRGGFGCVFRIRSKVDGKIYALKTVDLEKLKSVAASGDEVKRLETMAKREAEIMEKAQPHEHIVKVFGWFTEESIFHFVMELFERGTLKQAISGRNGVTFPEAKITNWAAQLAMTLKHLHNKNILHRDVKSENIFVTGNDCLKLGDFGIAKSLDGSTMHLAVGTITHAAPELFVDENSDYNDKAEVWAYGVVLYELTQLKLPFPVVNHYCAMIKAVCENPIPPIIAAVSPELRTLIESKLLDRKPATRPLMDQVICHPCILSALANQLALGRQAALPQPSQVFNLPPTPSPSPQPPVINPLSVKDLEKWFTAVEKGNLEQVKLFVRSGANPNQKNGNCSDYTALHWCGQNNYHEMAEFLLQNGANVDEGSRDRSTPLMKACLWGRKQVANVFVSHLANVNAKSNDGDTPLMKAADYGREEMVRWLVNESEQVNINEKNNSNKTALQIAIDGKNFWKEDKDNGAIFDRIIEFLRSKGATN